MKMMMKMIKVVFLADDKGTEDGNTIIDFKKSREYEISADLAKQFFSRRTAVEVVEKSVVEKSIAGSPENKMLNSNNNPNKTKAKLGVFKRKKEESEKPEQE